MNNKHIQIQYFLHNSFIHSKTNLYETYTLDILKTVQYFFIQNPKTHKITTYPLEG